MELYTERHGLRTEIEHTSTITTELYGMLFDCCKKYYDNLAWMYPLECTDGYGCAGLDIDKFDTHMKYDIPMLYRRAGWIDKPSEHRVGACDENTQYALLDLIEFIGRNCKDISIGDFHRYMGHHHMKLLDTNNVSFIFRDEINAIFQKVGLMYTLTSNMTVERTEEYSIILPEVEASITSVSEPGLKDLLVEAVELYKHPNPAFRNDAVEKLWDAFERLKTYYQNLDKRASATKIITDMSAGQTDFYNLFDAEFRALTTIGNDYRIRHHETSKIDITDTRHYDYFFNRCLSLITTAIQYLV